jgi:hypothetical protein
MRLFTSSYNFAGHLPKAVSISGWPPDGWDKKHCLKLAPKKWIYDNYTVNNDPVLYSMHFGIEVLSKRDPRTLANWLGDEAILCCYEPPGQFCHRKLVREWFNHNGIKCTELCLTEKLLIEKHGFVNLEGFIGPDD